MSCPAQTAELPAPRSTEMSTPEATESDGQTSSRKAWEAKHPRAMGYTWEDKYSRVVHMLPHEQLDRYVPGGFHPVALGDTLCNGRYTIRRKLGHGGFSIVWLARDSHEERWVSIKIKQASVSTDQLDDDPEIKALKQLEQHYLDTRLATPRCFSTPLDFFHHTGPNGTHTCLVTELLGPTLAAVLHCINDFYIQETLRPDTILRASKQLLEAVSFMHEAGLAHGDISPSNLAFTCNFAVGDDEDLWLMMGSEPTVAEYDGKKPRSHHLPRQLVASAKWPGWYDSPDDNLCLIDFGESFPINETRTDLAQPFNLRPPETFFIKSFDYRHDFWRAGCVIGYLFFQRSPVPFTTSDRSHVLAMVSAQGHLPSSWHTELQDFLKGVSDTPYLAPESDGQSLVDRFEARREDIIANAEKNEDYEKDEHTEDDYQGLRCLLHLMKGLMRHEPHKRMSAQEAAQSITWIDYWKEPKPTDVEHSGGE